MFGFGHGAPDHLNDPRYYRVNLQPLDDRDCFEVWQVDDEVECWEDGALAGARTATLSFGHATQLESGQPGAIRCAAEQLYAALSNHLRHAAHAHLLRIWNYFDAINEGTGDEERYRQFCVGRGLGLQLTDADLPAATAIGQSRHPRTLQVYWLSARQPGRPIENPRQVPAYHYPRCYGPKSPSFARAMAGPPSLALPLMLSGTASVVGHHSRHDDDLAEQIAETFRNFDALRARAQQDGLGHDHPFDGDSLLKVYVRREDDLAAVRTMLATYLHPDVPRLFLRADICRSELLIEIDGFHRL
ncbi:MAG: pteridine-dependent deoxygenase [Xanthomonadales bacterium]|nr:pteridine-dependent deoxygenase [Xanthomonadales bacterium]